MAPNTYASLPSDVQDMVKDRVILDPAIPEGHIRRTMTPQQFAVEQRRLARLREARKRQRHNRRIART